MANIIVIDDNSVFAKLVKELLTNLGHQVTIAGNLVEVESAIQIQQNIELAIVDFWLENETGLDVMKRLRATSPELPCIFVSGGSDIGMSLETSTALAEMDGADAFLYKPFSSAALQLKIDQMLR